MTTLLEALASMRPEDLVEGAQIEVTYDNGDKQIVTLGPVEQTAQDDQIVSSFQVKMPVMPGSP